MPFFSTKNGVFLFEGNMGAISNTKNNILRITYSAASVALAMFLPFLTWQDVTLGNMFSLMHIPIFLCGFLCGWQWGAVVGFVSPLLRFLIFAKPPMPTALAMAFELCVYGLVAGILYKILPKKNLFLYVSLIGAMLVGRAAGGAAMFVIAGIKGTGYTMTTFFTSYFVNAIPGIVLHIVLVPLIVMALKNANLMPAASKEK